MKIENSLFSVLKSFDKSKDNFLNLVYISEIFTLVKNQKLQVVHK